MSDDQDERIARRVVALLDQRDLERSERLATAIWDSPPQPPARDHWPEYEDKMPMRGRILIAVFIVGSLLLLWSMLQGN